MFSRDPSVSIKASASSLCNNLTVLSSKEKQSLTYGVVHKAFVCITTVTKGTVVNQKQVSCKGEGAHSSSAVLQAKWCELPDRTVLVITSVKGAQMFETDGSIMIFWQALGESKEGVYSHFARGISAVGDKYICVGTSEGGIMVFDIPPRGTAVKLQETLTSHKTAIFSEDSSVRVWKLSADSSPTMEMVFQQVIADTQLCGARFTDLSGDSFGVTGYDLAEIIMFSKK
ncbi:hypothetical protein pdam_00008826 [Pocillopora damicornis]|uniref:WD repeat-containing protein 54 beta-propeller domain-containing protein n=1 Tax=Pocillopora damicornis TaxID=46731 RepID=A0A3M6URX8_POCDA|nr:hypothetical protein pdam_00008826 [Pocillopora damicornis]